MYLISDILKTLLMKNGSDSIKIERFHRSLGKLLEMLWKDLIFAIDEKWIKLESVDSTYKKLIKTAFDKFYSPRLSKKAKTQILNKLSTINDSKVRTYEIELKLAEEFDLLYVIDNGLDKQLVISPEGMAICFLIQNNLRNTSSIITSYSSDDVKYLNSMIYKEYRSYITYKIKQLDTAGNKLTVQEMGLVIFLIYNGNIGKSNALKVTNDSIKHVISDCVQAFEMKNSDTSVSLFLLDRILPHIQRKFGYLFVNEGREYYLREDNIPILIEKLKFKQEESLWNNDFERRWMSFRNEYENQAPILRAMQNYHFSPKHRRLIESNFIK